MSFSASVHAPWVTPSKDGRTWTIHNGDRNVRFSLRKAHKRRALAVFTDFIWYGIGNSQSLQRCGALSITKAYLSDDGRTATALGDAVANQTLIDLLSSQGAFVRRTEIGYEIDARSSARVRLDPGSRIANYPALAMTPDRYLHHADHPEILRNALIGLFVAHPERAETPLASTSVQLPKDPSGKAPAGERTDEVGASEAWPKAEKPSALDLDQKRAVGMALTGTAMVIDGPPGTGKSATITAIADQIVLAGRKAILTSTETSALDVARRRLKELGIESKVTIGTPAEIASSPPPTVGVPDYDLVMIDECSRMPLAVALPLLTRARAVVLIGDDRQLRPDEPGETVLDRATSLALPRTTLRFHYRSQDRSLITPSNIMAYGSALRTAPSPKLKPTDGLRMIDLPEGRTVSTHQGAANPIEAQAIIDKIAALRSAEDQRSIGIITANLAQKDMILKMLGKTVRSTGSIEPLFVRTVQQSQGEERDIILISTVYDGRDKRDSFGLFDDERSVERLNVMLSRSRSEMWIYTSFRRSTPRMKSPPGRGRITFEGMRMILDVMTQAELRLATPTVLHETAKRLGMSVDNLGIVYGFRYAGADTYRIGLVLTDAKSEEHWSAIEIQLRSIGWTTTRMTENDLRIRPASAASQIQAAIAAASNRLSGS